MRLYLFRFISYNTDIKAKWGKRRREMSKEKKEIQVRCQLTERQYRRYMRFHVLGSRKAVGTHLLLFCKAVKP